jgi:Ca2+-binding EF-hand superfamily protein
VASTRRLAGFGLSWRYEMFSKMLMVVATVAVASGAAAGQRERAMRFQNLDVDRDGRISRAEWNGSDRSFAVQDWNGDGVLSGDEVRPGAGRTDSRTDDDQVNTAGSPAADDGTEEAFRDLDRNGDGRVTTDEWSLDRAAFRRADHNDDGVVTRPEFLGDEQEGAVDGDDEDDAVEVNRFNGLDTNRDNRVSRAEWRDGRAGFDRLDENRDGVLTRAEMLADPTASSSTGFSTLDIDRNGVLTRGEWLESAASFNRLDLDRDGRLTSAEFENRLGTEVTSPDPSGNANRTAADRAGSERGVADGRSAGREDRVRNQGFDLEGQRELEQADAGYDARIGSRAEYQAGYRAAFRVAYSEGYGWR